MSKFIKIFFIGVITSVLLLIVGHLLLQHSSILSQYGVLSHYNWLNVLWRLIVYTGLYCLWPHLIALLGKRQGWDKVTIVYLQKQRIKFILFFLIIETFFVYNVIGQILVVL